MGGVHDVEALARTYLDAVVEVALDEGGVVVEPAPLGTADGVFPSGVGTIHVLTACNPGSRRLAECDNDARNQRLADDLRSARLVVVPALGRSPDGAWREPSFAVVDGDREVVLKLAASHGQHAVYAWTPTERSVVWAGPFRGRIDRQGWRCIAAGSTGRIVPTSDR